MIYLYLAGALGGLALVIAVWFYRRRALGAEKERDRATADLAAAETAAAQERERQNGAFHASESFGDRYEIAVEGWLRSQHPELAGEYTGLVLRLASGATGAGVATLPVAGAAVPAGQRGGAI